MGRSERHRRRRIALVALAVTAVVALPVAVVTVRLARGPSEQAEAANRKALAKLGVPTDRGEFVRRLPQVSDEENLARPFMRAADGVDRSSPLWSAFVLLRDLPEPDSYPASLALTPQNVLTAIAREKQERPDPFAEDDARVSPEARAQIQALVKASENDPRPDALEPAVRWALINAVLDANAPALEAAAAAPHLKPGDSVKADFGIQWGKRDTPMSLLDLSYMGRQRHLSQLLHAAAARAAAEGRAGEALERGRQMLVQSEASLAAAHSLVQYLAALDLTQNALQAIQRAAKGDLSRADDADRLVTEVASLLDDGYDADSRAFWQAWSGQLINNLDALDHITLLRDQLGAGAKLTNRSLSDHEIRRNAAFLIEMFLRQVPATRPSTLPEAKKTFVDSEAVERRVIDEEFALAAFLLPSTEHTLTAHFLDLAERRRTAVALAVARYRADHQKQFPPSLEALVPGYLAAVPRDPTALDATVRYDAKRRRVWTAGRDGDDDGGRTLAEVEQDNPDARLSERLSLSDDVTDLH